MRYADNVEWMTGEWKSPQLKQRVSGDIHILNRKDNNSHHNSVNQIAFMYTK